ncbi:MAG: hypothetical protein P1V97_12400 [Planctomycetota bacterium]|nr:hypothetical protein [Planctomycetota bacterium]
MPWSKKATFAKELAKSLKELAPPPKTTAIRHPGSASEICKTIVETCWNGDFFCAAKSEPGLFSMRVFAFAIKDLIALGHHDRCQQTVEWALDHYVRRGRITPYVSAEAGAVEPYGYSSDALPFLFHTLKELGQSSLRGPYQALIDREILLYKEALIETASQDLRVERFFDSFKNSLHFPGSCYSHCMVAWCSELLTTLEWDNPLKDFELKATVNHWFWIGKFFRNHHSSLNDPLLSADANFWPFWCELSEDRAVRLAKCVEALHDEGLDEPFPLKYHRERLSERELQPWRRDAPNIHGDSIGTVLLAPWIELVHEVKPERALRYLTQIKGRLEQDGNLYEAYDPDGKEALKGSRWGGLWAAKFPKVLALLEPTN